MANIAKKPLTNRPKDKSLTRTPKPVKMDLLIKFLEKQPYRVVFNEVLQDYSVLENGFFNHLNPHDERALYCETVQKTRLSLSVEEFRVTLSKFAKKVNPIKCFFDELQEQRLFSPRLENIQKVASWLKSSRHTTDFISHHLAKWMVRSVRSVYEPGYFNKQALIFISVKESIGKSFFCGLLCPEKLASYLQANYRLTDEVDAQSALAMNFIINLDEIDKYTLTGKVNYSSLKNLISQTTIKVRLKNDKRDSFLTRRANFLGTSNALAFKKREAGYSRWVLIHIDGIERLGDFGSPKLKETKDTILRAWADALEIFRASPTFGELTQEQLDELKVLSEDYTEVSIEEQLVIETFELKTDDANKDFYTLADVVAILRENYKEPSLNRIAISRVLSQLDFPRKTIRGVRGYYLTRRPN